MKTFFKLLIVGIMIFSAAYLFINFPRTEEPEAVQEVAQEEPDDKTIEGNPTQTPFNKEMYSIDEINSIWLVVNKDRPIDTSYVPENLVKVEVKKRRDKSEEELMLRQDAAKALESMFAGAIGDGINLQMGSAYRSADLQNFYYTNYVNAYGQAEADKFSARPGTSEHQTGLGVDVSGVDLVCYLETCFADTPEGQWVKNNAREFGFIVRYPEGKEGITGYQFEPWHLRFVGVELAKQMYMQDQTLEEFFDLVQPS